MLTRRLAIFALSAAATFAADASLLKLLPPDAHVVMGLDVEQGKNSPFGRYLLSQMQSDDEGITKLVNLTGFDPRRDLREIVFASRGTGVQGSKDGLFAARGAFNVAKIIAAANSEGGQALVYQGFNVVAGRNGDTDGWIAFLDSTLAVGGVQEEVKAAIARRTSGTANANIATLGRTYDAWMYTVEPAALGRAVPAGQANSAELFKAVQSAQGGVKLGNTITVTGEAIARSDKDATALHDVIKFVAGMIQLKSTEANATEVASLLDSMKLSTSGTKLNLTVSIPQSQLEQFIERSRRSTRKTARVQ
jgi:hypothetical protein